ncbi:hypothetical protein N7519_001002 [Penicillium mononematosum]|uniref:uncharacterized protein n=1 Tax=Penicillium mononematosum TaxID=268346 RepID=UPI0025470E10|nr:uncharacterized protein N7519_001002 [Penicillium mononematosum]KAJ6190981.1 hypothetical protein N7519_001002 [Penicillium mononematosum]
MGCGLAILFLWYLLCRPTLGWGDVGHRTVAYLTEQYLTERGTEFLNKLLPQRRQFDISDAATWADEIKQECPETKPWHYVDVTDDPLGNICKISSLPRECKSGKGCIISAIEDMTFRVDDDSFNQTEAVMFLFHFFGDLHMPLHIEGYENGGNGVKVCFDGHKDNLHSIWDTDMPHKINGINHTLKHNDEKLASLKWARYLFQKNKHRPTTAVECADVTSPRTCIKLWAEETNRLNCAVVFKRGLPYLTGVDLAGEYYDDAAPIIAEQIFKAGVRLAGWINALAEKCRVKAALVVQGDPMRDL